jgi:hypothetical protein
MSQNFVASTRAVKFASDKVATLMGTLPKDKSSDLSVYEIWGREFVGAMVRPLRLVFLNVTDDLRRIFWSLRRTI